MTNLLFLSNICSDLRSYTMHLQNVGPTSEKLKHGFGATASGLNFVSGCIRVNK